MDAQKIRYINWWQKAPAPQGMKEKDNPTITGTGGLDGASGVGPLIQPLVIVPYSSPEQPMYYYNPYGEDEEEESVPAEYYEDLFEDEEAYALPDVGRRGKRGRNKKRK